MGTKTNPPKLVDHSKQATMEDLEIAKKHGAGCACAPCGRAHKLVDEVSKVLR